MLMAKWSDFDLAHFKKRSNLAIFWIHFIYYPFYIWETSAGEVYILAKANVTQKK